MDFQTALRIPWIHKFLSDYIHKQAGDRVQIIELEDKFHLKCSTPHGFNINIITETPIKGSMVGQGYIKLLNTCIFFEEHGDNPLIFYTANSNYIPKLFDCDQYLFQSLCLDRLTKQLSKKN